MSRLVSIVIFAGSLSVLSLSVGCDSGGNTVIEDTRSEAEIQQEMDDYEKQMEEAESANVQE